MELKDTISMMTSEDYKERFKAEYYQVKIRYDKLFDMLNKWDEAELDFEPTCPKWMYQDQVAIMSDYLEILEERAKLENIEIGY